MSASNDQVSSLSRRGHRFADAELSLEPPPNWTHEALCAQVDPELFYPEKGGSSKNAKQICGHCDVREQCLAYALEHADIHGVWGGTVARDRMRILRSRGYRKPDGPVPTSEHGTEARYRRHLRAGEQACEACAQANRVGSSARKARQQKESAA